MQPGHGAMTIKEELHIDCPPAMAFDLMADVRHLTTWNDAASRAELIGSEPIGNGSRFIAVNRGQEAESTIVVFDRPDHLEFEVLNKRLDVAATFTFTEEDGRTRLNITFEPRPKGLMSALFPILKPLIRRDLAKQHLKFKDFCETRAKSPATP
jgi:uncharacterized protein YndB with AHSA1/START domain